VNRGNLDQTMLRLRGSLHAQADDLTSDALLSGYRLWQRPEGATSYLSLGDDLVLQETVGAFVSDKVQINGLARYEYSDLSRLDLRVLGGVGVAVLPVRRQDRRLRLLAGVLGEHARYPGETFRIDVAHSGGRRTLARLTAVCDGFLVARDETWTVRSTNMLVVNPAEPRDLRVLADATVELRAWGPLQAQLGGTYTYSSVVLQGVDPHNLQVTAGVSLTGKGKTAAERAQSAAQPQAPSASGPG
jgi:hypothetical protein